ncbi:uncharacterized protein LOC106770145 [Vigna radiata var. radiata]|uniref:Uncharacterized protein LOC106770145 n=1 Tax=Vigna radiata var. radiata TaxID=3916 RepID=A0A1S3UZY1_VIGRR|nr:uncharacterized protein LOC106770145 [Vigna radiata var. radiata]
MEMEESDRVSEFFNRVIAVANQMKNCGETISDIMIMEKIMRSMPPAFDHIVVAIEESKDLEKLKIKELQSSFEAYEMRRREGNPVKRDDQALKIQHVSGEGKKKYNKWKDCSNHMKYNKDWLMNLDESKKSKVRVVDNNMLKVEGIGSVKIKRKNGLYAMLENVLLVLKMKCNLLSVGRLTEKGFIVIMGSNGQMELYDQGSLRCGQDCDVCLLLKKMRAGDDTLGSDTSTSKICSG